MLSICNYRVLLVLLGVFLSNTISTRAQTVVEWAPLDKDASSIEELKMSANGKYVAAMLRSTPVDSIKVWRITPQGQLGPVVWNSLSRYRNSLLYGFEWWNDDLLLSKIDSPQPLKPLDTVQGDLQQDKLFQTKRGNTVQIRLPNTQTESVQVKAILSDAYALLSTAPSLEYLAASQATPATLKAQSAKRSHQRAALTFYRRLGTGQFTIEGHWHHAWQPSDLPLSEGYDSPLKQSPLVGWSATPPGVFVYDIDKNPQRWPDYPRTQLFFVSLNGKAKPILPFNLSFRGKISHYGVTQTQPFWCFTDIFNVKTALTLVDASGVKQRLDDNVTAWNHAQDGQDWLGISPNNRFLLFSTYPREGQSLEARHGLWLHDLQRQRRRRLSSHHGVAFAQWANDAALMVIPYERDKKLKQSFRCLLLHFPEGTLPADDPKLDELVSLAPWEDAIPPAPARTTDEQAAITFLNDPELLPVAFPARTSRFPNPVEGWEGAVVFSLNGLNDRASFVAVDAATHRVIGYSAPPPLAPMPAQPVTPEVALKAAQNWLQKRALVPATEVLSPPALPQLTPRGRYRVRLESSIHCWEIEVAAWNGRIAAFRESRVQQSGVSRNVRATAQSPLDVKTPLLFEDRWPRFSPDGTQIAWISNRPRAGYPAWWIDRPSALWIAQGDGSKAQLLVESGDVQRAPLWSSDGKWLAWENMDGNTIGVVNVATGQRIDVPPTRNPLVRAVLLGWNAAHELMLGWIHNGPGSCDLMRWKPVLPVQTPHLVKANWSDSMGPENGRGAMALNQDGSELYVAWRLRDNASPTRSCAFALWSFRADNLTGTPRKIADCLPVGDALNRVGMTWWLAGINQAVTVSPNGKFVMWQPPTTWPTFARRVSPLQLAVGATWGQFASAGLTPEGSRLALHVFKDFLPLVVP